MKNQIKDQITTEPGWKNLYKIGGAAALVCVLVYLLDVAISFTGTELAPASRSAIEWYTKIQENGLLELRNLGLFNVISMIAGIPLFLALFAAHHHREKIYAALAIVIFFVTAAVYISINPSIPMGELSRKYTAATTDAQRLVLAGAGEALLAQGEDFTPGSFVGFIGGEIALLGMSVAMLRGKVFSPANAFIGMAGFFCLILFTIWSTFVAGHFSTAMIIALVGGLLSITWYVLTARRLFQLSRASETQIPSAQDQKGGK